MSQYRTARFASTVLTSLTCLVLASCAISAGSSSPSTKAPSHEQKHRPEEKPKKKTAKKKHNETVQKDVKQETTKDTSPPKTDTIPTKPTKETEPKSEAPLENGVSRIVVPVSVKLKDVQEKLEEELPKTESRNWKRVTKPGKRHEVDVRYDIWREPLELSMKGHTLRVTVPVRYASEFRAKVKKPIGKGSFWLTRGETWGTKERQQRMEVTIDVALNVSKDYALESDSKLVSIKHGEPPEGNACGKVGVEVCVPKKELASYVEDEMNERVGKKLEKLLKKGDKKIGKLFDLRKRVDTLWAGLSTPVELQKPKQVNCPTAVGEVCSKSAWLTFAPTTLGLSPLELKEERLGVRIELQGKLSVSTDKPKPKTPQLPKLESITGGTAFELTTTLDIPLSQLTEKLNPVLTATPFRLGSGSLKFKSVSIAVRDGSKKAVVLELVSEKDHKLSYEAKLDFDPKKKLLGLTNVVPNAETKALLENELKDFDVVALRKAIDEHATVALEKASESLRKAVADSLSSTLPGKLRLKGTLSGIAVEDFRLSEKAVAANVVLKGTLGVEFSL